MNIFFRLRQFTTVAAIMCCVFILSGCKKFLDKKPNQALVVPETLGDLQALLDNYMRINRSDPIIDEAATDNIYFLTDLELNNGSATTIQDEPRIYKWEKDYLFFNDAASQWSFCYSNVYVANTILDNIVNIERTDLNKSEWDNIKGQALVIRAKALLQAAFIWTVAYDSLTANNDLGLPLRLNSDFNQNSVRSSVQATYDRIIKDFEEAIPLLPNNPLSVLRASKPAALAFLARTYLSMRKYDKALYYADQTLQIKSKLQSYNDSRITGQSATAFSFATVTFSTANPNPEILMSARASTPVILENTKARIDSVLFKSYLLNDKRKTVYFRITPIVGFRGSYDGTGSPFTGIAVDEVYLMRAECYARANNKTAAMADLDTLLTYRFAPNTYVSPPVANAGEALNVILTERRKELVYRGLRWMDLKRLNKEGANLTLTRNLSQVYTLPPNDLRYAMALPEDVLLLSGMPQNPR